MAGAKAATITLMKLSKASRRYTQAWMAVFLAGSPALAQSTDPCHNLPPENCITGDDELIMVDRLVPESEVSTDDGRDKQPYVSVNPFANSQMCGDAICFEEETCQQDCPLQSMPGGGPPDPSGDWDAYSEAPLRANPDLVPGVLAGKSVSVTLDVSAAAVDRPNYDTQAPRTSGDQAAREFQEAEYDPESALSSAAGRAETEISTAEPAGDPGDTEPSREQSALAPPLPQQYDEDLAGC